MSRELDLFKELFKGSTSSYGLHIPEPSDQEGVKAKGQSFTKTEPLVPELYEEHIEGKKSIGIIPIDSNNNVRFCAIDVDVYPLNPATYCRIIERFNLPLTCFKSKSGGLHIYLFFSQDTSADKALDCVNIIRHVLSIPKDTETFPKQRRLVADQKGNWINLPYYNGEKSTRVAYNGNGEPISFSKAMELCYAKRTSIKALEELLENLPFSSGPPCLQCMFMNSEVSVTSRNRNIFLFNVAVYLKARFGEEFGNNLAIVNSKLDKPLEQLELERTVISSHKKGNYTYQCEDVNLRQYCDKELCKAREYGKGAGTVSNFSFERLVQVQSNPPYYKWTISGFEMVFFSEAELRSQEKFIDYCIRYLHKMPNKLKAPVWNDIINNALNDIEVEKVFDAEDVSDYSLWFSYLVEFLTERRLAERPSQTDMGQVYFHEDMFYFKPEAFIAFLQDIKRFRTFTTATIHYNLRKLGFAPCKLYDDQTKKSKRVWRGSRSTLMSTLRAEDPKEPPVTKKGASDSTNSVQKLREAIYSIEDTTEEVIDDNPPWEEEEFPEEPLDFSGLVPKEKF